nr:Farp protein [Dugesia japonica]
MENQSSPLKRANLSKYIGVRVTLLDDSVQHFHVSTRALGQHLYNQVIAKLQLLESDYFDLEYINKEGVSCWLDHLKQVVKQCTQRKEYIFQFGIKFYAPYPNMLEDEYTRYLFALQIKRDIYQGHLQCNINTTALLLAFIAQSEIGDFLEDEYDDYTYLSSLRLTKQANEEFLMKVMECHRTLVGQSPSEADYNLLDTARKVESYGIKLHPARDHENLPLKLAVSHQGIVIHQNRIKINVFSWAKVRKLSFKRKRFYIKLHAEGYGYFKDIVEFIFNSRNECKNFWKQCIEHHAFFRCQAVKQGSKRRSKVLSKGSSYRYTGRTQKQLQECVRETSYRRPQFERSLSMSRVSNIPKSPASSVLPTRHTRLASNSYAQYKSESNSAGECRSQPTGNLSGPMGMLLITGGTASSASYTMNSSAASARSRTVSTSSDSSQHQKTRSNKSASALLQNFERVPRRSISRPSLGSRNRRSLSHSPPVGSTNRSNLPHQNNVNSNQRDNYVESPLNTRTLPAGFGRGYSLMSDQSLDCNSRIITKSQEESSIPNYTELARLISSGSNSGPKPQNIGNTPLSPNGMTVSHPQVISNEELKSSLTYLRKSQQRLDDLLIATMAAVGVEDPALSGMWCQNSLSNSKKSEIDVGLSNTNSYIFLSGQKTCVSPISQNVNHKEPFSTLLPGNQVDSDVIIQDSCSFDIYSNPPRKDQQTVNLSTRSIENSSVFNTVTSSSQMTQFPGYMASSSDMNRYMDAKNLKAALLNELKRDRGPPLPPLRSGSSLGKLNSPVQKYQIQNQPDVLPTDLKNLKLTEQISDDDLSRPTSADGSRASITRDPSLNLSRGGSLSRRSSTSSSRRSHHQSSKKRPPMDKSFHIIKEVLMTERTYKRSLDIICIWFRKAVASGNVVDLNSRLPEQLSKRIFSLLDPIHEQHTQILKELENRVMVEFNSFQSPYTSRANSRFNVGLDTTEFESNTEKKFQIDSNPVYRVSDIFLQNLCIIPLYKQYLESAESILLSLDQNVRSNSVLKDNIRKFEIQKVCFMPLYAYFLTPAHRVLQYRQTFERLLRHIGENHPDSKDCKLILVQLQDLIQGLWDVYKKTENTCKLLELQRDIVGFQTLSNETSEKLKNSAIYEQHRNFIREGWLQKLGKKGYQQRMFFMFSDQLVYTNKLNGNILQFKVHGQFPLHDLMIEESEPTHSFTVYSGNRCFLVAANSQWQRDRWLEDISRAILAAKSSSSLTGNGTVDGKKFLIDDSASSEQQKTEKSKIIIEERYQIQQRSNTSVHVCWHRNCSLAFTEILRANENELSGYLLRKFKNSNGWQKLWVVFTQLCLFFFKNYQDDSPLATLPLIGYLVCQPSPEDQIRKDFVFKLQFKNHVYFFRGDSQYTYDRWFECLNVATGSANKLKSTPSVQTHNR